MTNRTLTLAALTTAIATLAQTRMTIQPVQEELVADGVLSRQSIQNTVFGAARDSFGLSSDARTYGDVAKELGLDIRLVGEMGCGCLKEGGDDTSTFYAELTGIQAAGRLQLMLDAGDFDDVFAKELVAA